MPQKQYKPRLGFDIRVKPPARGQKPPAWAEPKDAPCAAPDCKEPAACSLPKSPREPRERIWLCLDHAREHNRSWNYFDGLSDDEAKKVREASQYGDRPTWSMGRNERARAAAKARGAADLADSYGLFGREASVQVETRGQFRGGKRLTKLQINAFETLALPVEAPAADIRRRYAELVRRFHPDSNGGDRSAEQQLTEVVKAHQILKKAQFL
ncbi:MAG: J domain-containing protein [Parvularculaceae bacterium]